MVTDPLLGRVLRARYRIERKLGQGGMGCVYAAVHLELARPVAVKTLLDVVDPRDLDRFRTEALAAASLSHPHIVAVTDFVGPKGDEPAFLVMELLAGRSLDRVLAQRGALPADTAIHVTLQVLDAIGAAHDARILHRDIKPANIVVLDGADATRPWIKVVDFGIAKMMDEESRHTTTGTMLGTPAYMAPEQLRGERATERSDIYAIGVCLYEMLAGSRPFAKTGGEVVAEILRGEAPALPVDAALAAIVRRAMDRDPAERFASTKDFAAALRELSAERPPPLPTASRSRRTAFAVAVVSTIAVSAVVLVVLAKRNGPSPHARIPDAVDAAPVETSAVPSATPSAEPSSVPSADLDAAGTDDAGTSDAPAARKAKGVLSFCSDGKNMLCARPMWTCECRAGDFAVYDSPEDHHGAYVFLLPETRDGQECTGWTHGSSPTRFYIATPQTGRYRCFATCNDALLRAAWKVAVPNTPCTGYLQDEPIAGKWKPVPQSPLR